MIYDVSDLKIWEYDENNWGISTTKVPKMRHLQFITKHYPSKTRFRRSDEPFFKCPKYLKSQVVRALSLSPEVADRLV